MLRKIPQIKLNNGREMPIIGLGTYAVCHTFTLGKQNLVSNRQAVEWGIDAGYRHIDTAACYHNEEEVGAGIASKIKEGVVTRDQLFVTTKLWNDQHAEKAVVPALKQSLTKLKLDYVDLYLIHWPISVNEEGDMKIDFTETWKGMEEAVELGLTRSIGVSNFNAEQLQRLVQVAKIKPVVNQIEINPTFTSHSLVECCKQLSVVPVAYTPLGLISEARPEFIGKDVIKTDPKLGGIADKYNKSRAQIALRYLIQRGIAVLPKSFTKSRIEENIDVFDFELTEDEMKIVDSYNIDHRCVPGLGYVKLNNYPF